ncbi:hypothetical protein NMG60_11019200 [Bertholletia excelsa]
MGCIASRIDKEERVKICKERKMLMKQIVRFRGEFADAQLTYLRALKNTGVTLRQFSESESLELENTSFGLALPSSPPPPLPPSPPPPPTFSPDLRKFEDNRKVEISQEEIIDTNEEKSSIPPPPVPSSSWDFWDPFIPSLPHCGKSEIVDPVEEENWAEANTEFEGEEQEEAVDNNAVNLSHEKPQINGLVDDNLSMISSHTRDTSDMAMVVWRSKKTFAGIVKELDDYFLKASAGGKDIAVFMDVSSGDSFVHQSSNESNGHNSNSGKVFNALTWSWSSKSLQYTTSATKCCDSTEPCRPGAHCLTLGKVYAEEQRLYKDIKDEEIAKLEHERKSFLLQKQQSEDYAWTKTEKTRVRVESLQSNIVQLQESITTTHSSISKLIEEELHPQLIAIISGLMKIWRTICECHQIQYHISQQVSHLTNHQCMDPTTDYRMETAVQLKTEVTSWYSSFCRLVISQKEYVKSLSRWIQLTDCFLEDSRRSGSSSAVHNLCEEWQLALDRLPDKVASEAIKSFLSAIQSIVLQQQEELNLQKRSDRLEKKLQRESNMLAEMETKLDRTLSANDVNLSLSPKHPLLVKRAKIEALRKQVNDEKAKYLTSTQVTQSLTVNSLHTSLPNVFQALMGFSSAHAESLDSILSHAKTVDYNEQFNPLF